MMRMLAFFATVYVLMFILCLNFRPRPDATTAMLALVLTVLVSIGLLLVWLNVGLEVPN
jgi:Sec-independent protein secretion pathway component TatC